MKSNFAALWAPFGFAVALSAISLVTFSATAGSSAWVPAFVAFLPMVFYMGIQTHTRSRAQVELLEGRVRELETRLASGARSA
jgi:hypothetical protein